MDKVASNPVGPGRAGSPSGVYDFMLILSQVNTWERNTHNVTLMKTTIYQEVGTVNERRVIRSDYNSGQPSIIPWIDEGDHIRKTTALACSTASPNLPIGTCTIRLFNFSGVLRKSIKRGVRIGPGQSELNRIPSRAWTIASSRVMASTAPLEAVSVSTKSTPAHGKRKKEEAYRQVGEWQHP